MFSRSSIREAADIFTRLNCRALPAVVDDGKYRYLTDSVICLRPFGDARRRIKWTANSRRQQPCVGLPVMQSGDRRARKKLQGSYLFRAWFQFVTAGWSITAGTVGQAGRRAMSWYSDDRGIVYANHARNGRTDDLNELSHWTTFYLLTVVVIIDVEPTSQFKHKTTTFDPATSTQSNLMNLAVCAWMFDLACCERDAYVYKWMTTLTS